MGKKAGLVALISGTQIGCIFVFGFILWGVLSKAAALSLILGGLVGVLAGLYMAVKVFAGGVKSTPVFLARYYSGHMLKLLIVAIMLPVIFLYTDAEALWVMCGLCITQIIYLIILPFIKRP